MSPSVLLRMSLPPVLMALVAGAGCSSAPQDSPDDDVALIQASAQIPEDQLLDMVVRVFDPGLPDEGQQLPPGVFPELRKSEAMYFAVRLGDTLQGTGHWGAVRVAPAAATIADLMVSGTIIQSTGTRLILSVMAIDSTGRTWLDRKFKAVADPAAYTEGASPDADAFQNIYNEISNELVRALRDRSPSQITEIRRVTALEYAADLLPTVYSDYLETNRRGFTKIRRLAAEGDPMMERIARVREREAMFVDVLNQHYGYFYNEMRPPYDDWRRFAYEEETALEEVRRKARTQKILGAIAVLGAVLVQPSSGAEAAIRDIAVLGGMAAVQAGFATSKEAKIHIEALQELGASFESEVEPLVIDVEGHTLRLTGSVAEQYETWRTLLREIYTTETGLPVDPNQALDRRPSDLAMDP